MTAVVTADLDKLIRIIKNLTDIENQLHSTPRGHVTGLGKKRQGRYLFHILWNTSTSLRLISESMRNTLIFVYTWLYKELKYSSMAARLLQPIITCADHASSFKELYAMALTIIANTTNQSESPVTSSKKAYISADLAAQLLESINTNCNELTRSFIELTLSGPDQGRTPENGLFKRMEIIKESFMKNCDEIKKDLHKLPAP
jgi:hypothetical protein